MSLQFHFQRGDIGESPGRHPITGNPVTGYLVISYLGHELAALPSDIGPAISDTERAAEVLKGVIRHALAAYCQPHQAFSDATWLDLAKEAEEIEDGQT